MYPVRFHMYEFLEDGTLTYWSRVFTRKRELSTMIKPSFCVFIHVNYMDVAFIKIH